MGGSNVTHTLTLKRWRFHQQGSGCKASVTGCDIGISKSSFLYTPHSTVLVSVLTSLGNVFSIPYPTPSLNTLKNVIVINQNQFNQENINQNQVDIVNQSETIGCSQCNFFLVAGGNILVTQITATPSPVANGKTINVTATVWDYSSYSAVDANVTLKSVYTGAASVLPDISASGERCGAKEASIAQEGFYVFTCTFTAQVSGTSYGFVSFIGSAQACAQTGNTTTCSGGVLVTSATVVSNPVQVGNAISFGPWQSNYYFFTYTAKSQTTQSPAAAVASSDHYVAFYVKLVNTYTEPLTILDGSYLQFVSPGTDVSEYMVNGSAIKYTATPTFTANGRSDSPPVAPVDSVSGENCLTVDPGDSTTLLFAAASSGSGTWEWGSGTSPGARTWDVPSRSSSNSP